MLGPYFLDLLIDLGYRSVSSDPDNDKPVGVRCRDCYGVTHSIEVSFDRNRPGTRLGKSHLRVEGSRPPLIE